jgi:uncharacterized membrane protein YiaA
MNHTEHKSVELIEGTILAFIRVLLWLTLILGALYVIIGIHYSQRIILDAREFYYSIGVIVFSVWRIYRNYVRENERIQEILEAHAPPFLVRARNK